MKSRYENKIGVSQKNKMSSSFVHDRFHVLTIFKCTIMALPLCLFTYIFIEFIESVLMPFIPSSSWYSEQQSIRFVQLFSLLLSSSSRYSNNPLVMQYWFRKERSSFLLICNIVLLMMKLWFWQLRFRYVLAKFCSWISFILLPICWLVA